MKCEEALTKIEAYINHTLNGRELEEFLEHVTSCQECYDELETYYIISVGMRYLEEENLESYNIPKMLQEDLHTRERRVRRRIFSGKQRFFLVCFFFIVILVLGLSYLGHLELPRLLIYIRCSVCKKSEKGIKYE